MDNKKPTKPK